MSDVPHHSSSSHLIESVSLATCFFQCFMLLFSGSSSDAADPMAAQASWHMSIMLHLFSMATLLMNNHFRGTRIHLYPLLMGFVIYSIALFFDVYEEITFYYYYLTVLISILMVVFFGTTNYYSQFETSGARKHSVGCVTATMKGAAGNRVIVYYPCGKDDKTKCADYKWAMDGEHTIKGLMKFGADILPQGPFRHMAGIR